MPIGADVLEFDRMQMVSNRKEDCKEGRLKGHIIYVLSDFGGLVVGEKTVQHFLLLF